MVSKIKALIRDKLNTICYERYVQEVERQKDVYRQWYLHNEGWKKLRYPKAGGDIVIFADRDGVVEEKAAGVTADFFARHPAVMLAYADEDCLDEEGRRHSPWFKPQWSPDTLGSFQYFGHYFAARRELLADMEPKLWQECLTDCSGAAAYRLLLALTEKITSKEWIPANGGEKAIAPIGKVLIHMKREKKDIEAADLEKEDREAAGLEKEGDCAAPCRAGRGEEGGETISVIVPSKDHPETLRRCLLGLREGTALETGRGALLGLELIVVDNGSLPENRKILEEMAQEFAFRYLYRPMPFNFSVMCNLGAKEAKGRYLLFLNDDIEIAEPLWLVKLAEAAARPYAGAVGAKLLYPRGDLIQHIGITNLRVGPVHKLLKQHDKIAYYHGQNRHIYDMIGVTAACLLIRTQVFWEAGGFFEGLAVSYNDVDLCYTLCERGYYNILRNDVTLFHHESLSRGDDNLSDEKWLRLLQEKDTLYERHPSLKGFDPFYSGNLAQPSNLYLPDFLYDYEKRDYYTQVRRWKGNEPTQWENGCLIVNVEHAREEKKLEFTERDDVYWIEGWSYVLGMDNCRYERRLLLQRGGGEIYEAAVLSRYRRDVAAILPQQKNVALAGFVCRIPRGALPQGEYTVSMLARDCCTRQRLYQRTKARICVKGGSVYGQYGT